IHISLWRDGKNLFQAEDQRRTRPKSGVRSPEFQTGSKLFRQFLGGLMKYSPELCYCFAPTINSYKRYQSASWAPTKMAWSHGNAYVDPRLRALPKSLRQAADLLDQSAFARKAFGDHVVDFYVRTARLEVEAYDNAVTDWERRRCFERI